MFIPTNKLGVGTKVVLLNDVQVLAGTFTEGHEFTVDSVGVRGVNLIDSEGRHLDECGFLTNILKVVE